MDSIDIKDLIVSIPKFNHIGEVITLVSGLVAAVLALVGLLSIFISINSQHNVQKCRELLWDLKGMEENDKIVKNIILYNQILSDDQKFTSKVINILRYTIYVVIGISLSLNMFLVSSFDRVETIYSVVITVIISIIFIIFSRLLSRLKDLHYISSLPKTKDLLNANMYEYIGKVNTLDLAANTLKMRIANIGGPKSNHLGLLIGFPMPFENLSLSIEEIQIKHFQDDRTIYQTLSDPLGTNIEAISDYSVNVSSDLKSEKLIKEDSYTCHFSLGNGKQMNNHFWYVFYLGRLDIDYKDIPIKGRYKVSISNTLEDSRERVVLNGEVECIFNVEKEAVLNTYNESKTPKQKQDEDQFGKLYIKNISTLPIVEINNYSLFDIKENEKLFDEVEISFTKELLDMMVDIPMTGFIVKLVSKFFNK